MSDNVKTLIGKKVGQTTLFEESGKATHVTVLEIGPCVVIQKKTQDKEGYNALQLGFSEKKEKHTTKALQGHFKKSGATPKRILKEIRVAGRISFPGGAGFDGRKFQRRHLGRCNGRFQGQGIPRCGTAPRFQGWSEFPWQHVSSRSRRYWSLFRPFARLSRQPHAGPHGDPEKYRFELKGRKSGFR